MTFVIVHVLLRGLPRCRFSREPPALWPKNHEWIHSSKEFGEFYKAHIFIHRRALCMDCVRDEERPETTLKTQEIK